MLGSDSLDEAEAEDDLLEKNNNDTQDTLDRVANCVRSVFTSRVLLLLIVCFTQIQRC